MPSFLDKLRNTATGNTSSNITTPSKKEKELPQTWLQKLQQEPTPVREDGNDKFFGVENFGNTCYFNSILQCLYYSTPFRELVLNYPNRSPISSILNDADGKPRVHATPPPAEQNGQAANSPAKGKLTPAQNSARSAGVPANPNKPEDKDSPEYKKKQAMLSGPILSLDYDNSMTYGMDPSLFTCLKDLFEAIIATGDRTGVASPKLFLKMLQDQNEMFRGAMHQDAHEFLNLLLNAVVDSVEAHTKKMEQANGVPKGISSNREGNASTIENLGSMSRRVHDLFQGTLTSETKCLTCENVSQRDEPFIDLSVDLENHCSVTSCLRKFSEEEMLCERDKFFCDNCGGLQEAEKRMKIKRLPKTLALHLKRFKYTEDFMRLQKLFHRVVYPYHLRLFNTTDDAEDPDRLYELYAVVVHIGSGPYHGHYISIIKTPDRGWLLFDDEMVEPVDKSFVRNFFGAQLGMACAYVLFYQETTLEAVKKEQEAEGLSASVAAAAAETIASADGKDAGLGLNIKTNGHGHAVSPVSPTDDDERPQWAKLAHAQTAPNSSIGGFTPLTATNTSTFPTPNIGSHTPLSPHAAASPLLSPGSRKPVDKKSAAKEEKERKQAEKAAEKLAKEEQKAAEKEQKAKRKSLEQKQKAPARNSIGMVKRRGTNNDPAPEAGTLGTLDGAVRPEANTTVNGTTLAAASLGGTTAAVKGATTVPSANLAQSPLDASVPSSDPSATNGPATTSVPLPSTNLPPTAANNISSNPPPPPSTNSTSTSNSNPGSTASHNHTGSFSASNTNPLSRFRTSSKSVSMRKSKLWGLGGSGRDSKDLSRNDKEDYAVEDGDEGDDVVLIEKGVDGKGDEEKDKNGGVRVSSGSGTMKKRGFSLRKKASSLLS